MIDYFLSFIFSPGFLFSIALSIGLCFHIVHTKQDTFWLWIVLMFQGVGSLAYIAVILIPSFLKGPSLKAFQVSLQKTIDPDRDYRAIRQACDDSPTVYNQMRLAQALFARQQFLEAEQLFRLAASGIHADDPALRLGQVKCLLELQRFQEALDILNDMASQNESQRDPVVILAKARALHGLGQLKAAEAEYRSALEKMPGFEAIARLTVFLYDVGRREDAQKNLEDIDYRIAKLSGNFRNEALSWRKLAFSSSQTATKLQKT